MGKQLARHVRDNRWQYQLLLGVMVLALALGAYRAGGMDAAAVQELWRQLAGADGVSREGLILAWFNQVRAALVIGLLGLTVIGWPVIPGVLFFRAYALGFSLAVLLKPGGGAAALNVVLGLVPPNLVYLALLLFWAVAAINFSLYIVNRPSGDRHLGRGLAGYALLLLVILAGLALGAVLELSLLPVLRGS